MKDVSKLLKTPKVMLELEHPMQNQKMFPHQCFGNIIRHGPKSNYISHG